MYLISFQEVFGYNQYVGYDTAMGNSRQLDYYSNHNVTTGNSNYVKKSFNNQTKNWWLRTADSYNGQDFELVSDYGTYSNYTSNSIAGISPAFRIG